MWWNEPGDPRTEREIAHRHATRDQDSYIGMLKVGWLFGAVLTWCLIYWEQGWTAANIFSIIALAFVWPLALTAWLLAIALGWLFG
jgi:hypothetical protein